MWTNEQSRAISERGKNILVSAAAGSGKTTVLVERIVALMMEEKVNIDEMLIVTFTNAAASDMKSKIQKRLKKILSEYISDIDTAKFIKKQIQKIKTANISTVHSFCMNVLKEYFVEADIDPRFKILKDNLAIKLRERVLEDVLEKKYKEANKDFLDFVDSYASEKNDEKIKNMILSIDLFSNSQARPIEWLNNQLEFYECLIDKNEFDSYDLFVKTDIGKVFLDDLCKSLEKSICYIDEIFEFLNNEIKSFTAILNEEKYKYLSLLKELEDKKLSSINTDAEFNTFRKKKVDNISDEDWEFIKEKRNSAKKLYNSSIEIIDVFKNGKFDREIEFLYKILSVLIEISIDYKNRYLDLKKENLSLEFSDLEHITLNLLKSEDVRKNLQNKFKYIFYDEYQDTNAVQEELINYIKKDTNLFLVGDVKQSIYRFRLADPSIFNKKYSDYILDDNSTRIDLSKNFRSDDNILQFANLIFSNIMSKEYGEVNYNDGSHHLVCGREEFENPSNVELCIVNSNNEEYELDDSEEDLKNIEMEAHYVAQKILSIKRDKDLQNDDIAILLRTMKNKANIFEKIINEYGIDCSVDYNSNNFERIEIRTILNYLKLIDNRKKDEVLIGTMLSIVGGFEIEELVNIRKSYSGCSFFLACENYKDEKKDNISRKLSDFYCVLDNFVLYSKMLSTDDLIWKILSDFSLTSYFISLENGEKRIENIREFARLASNYEKENFGGLVGFLSYLEPFLKGDIKNDSTLKKPDSVLITSIHKSKGLEYKVVFVCDLNKKINEEDLKKDIIMHKDFGIGIKYKNGESLIESDNLIRNLIKERKRKENISEEIRILYVALTRAIEDLYLVGSVNSLKKFAKSISHSDVNESILNTKSNLGFICSSLIREEKGYVLRAISDYKPKIIENKSTDYSINIIEKVDKLEDKTSKNNDDAFLEFKNRKLTDEEILFLGNQINFNYKYTEDTKKRSKISVSDIVREEKNKDNTNDKILLPNFKRSDKLNSMEIGTLVHLVLQLLPAKEYSEEELLLDIGDMIKNEQITQEEYELIPIKSILNFYNSDLGKKLTTSNRVYKEQSFLMSYEGSILEGIIDCYFVDTDDKIVLIDYKTDKDIDLVKHKHQLELYKKAIEEMEGKEVKEAYIYWVSHSLFSQII